MYHRGNLISEQAGAVIVEYSLFRVKFIKPQQASLLHYDVTPAQIFLSSLNERPTTEVKPGYSWHIGNVERYSPDTGYFALGRTTTKTFEKFNQDTGNFLVESLETSPYTHCVFDASYGFIGIAKKPALANTTTAIARRVKELLSFTREVSENHLTVEVDPIPDPSAFLREIRDAFRVARFIASFHGPNPFDADLQFQRPMSVYLAAADGAKGKTQIDGANLNRETLSAVTRSTASTGNDATAKIQKTASSRLVTIRMRGGVVGESYEDDTHAPQTVLSDLREKYKEVRGDSRNPALESGGSDSGLQFSS